VNAKKAKLLRRTLKDGVDKRAKKLYNQLSHDEKQVLSNLYKHINETKDEHILPESES